MNWPALAIAVIVGFYWTRVLRLAYKIRKRTGGSAHALPPEPVGRAIRLIWYPLVTFWIAIPLINAFRPAPASPINVVAAIVGLSALLATMVCWRRMGKSWRMGIDPGEKTALVVTGPYAYVRHPIYALSAILMIASLVVVPNPIMVVIAVVHLTLLHWEARREEKHLLTIHGDEYTRYLAHTGRFIPRSLSPFRSDR
jgi:protein-S-isoprenylcysteine O-methyltransferase Ste14